MNRGLVFYYSHGAWVRAAQASPQGVEGHSDLSAEGLLHKDELEREGTGEGIDNSQKDLRNTKVYISFLILCVEGTSVSCRSWGLSAREAVQNMQHGSKHTKSVRGPQRPSERPSRPSELMMSSIMVLYSFKRWAWSERERSRCKRCSRPCAAG